ncbi:hypothetical protein KY284_036159 [Solanum tuberosum]|nr:hypothetical protein KY284_036159 [Solanum tuberosum]
METNSEVSTAWSWPKMTEPLSFAELDYGASSSLVQDLVNWLWFTEAGGGGTTSSGFSGGCVLVISGEVLVVSRRFTGDGAVGFWLDEEDGMKLGSWKLQVIVEFARKGTGKLGSLVVEAHCSSALFIGKRMGFLCWVLWWYGGREEKKRKKWGLWVVDFVTGKGRQKWGWVCRSLAEIQGDGHRKNNEK